MTKLRACRRALVFALVVTAAMTGTSVSGTQNPAVDVVIRLDQRKQRIDGFGVSERIWTDPHLSDEASSSVPVRVQDEILAALFGDLGLTRLRPILEHGLEVENDNKDSGSLDLRAFDFSWKRTDDHVALVEQALGHGLEVYFPAPISFEEFMSNANPDEYVEWAMAVLGRWRELGAEPPFFSPVNEPGGSANRSAEWLVAVVKGLGARLEAEGFATKLVIPDDINLDDAYPRAAAVLSDPEARRYVGAVAYHLYGAHDDRRLQRMATLAAQYQLPVWMTEFSKRDYTSWPGVMNWATTMHRLLTTGNASAVDFLWGFFGDQERGHTLIALGMDQEGNYVSNSIEPAFWVTGQFSRFVRPGFFRVGTEPKSTIGRQALVTSFRGPRNQVVVVAINTKDVEQPLSFSISGGRALRGPGAATRSSASENGVELKPFDARGTRFSATLAPQSVTTLVARVRS